MWRSFQNHEEPERMMMAADYSDQWFAGTHSQFNLDYICKSGVAPGCLTVQRSNEWTRLRDDMTGQETNINGTARCVALGKRQSSGS